jgi:hypothetical protein
MHRHALSAFPAIMLLLGALAMPVLQGCARQPVEQPQEHTVRKVPVETPVPPSEPAPEKGTSAVLEAKDKFERTLNENLERLDEEIREVQAKVANLKDAAKAEWTEKLAEVNAKRRAAEAKLDEVRKAAAGAWEHLREGADRAWDELEQSVEKARKEF